MELRRKNHPTPVGNLLVVVDDDDHVVYLSFDEEPRFETWRSLHAPKASVAEATFEHAVFQQLDEYFDGERTTFDVSVKELGTEFQLKVWAALREIPFGETRSYSDIAEIVSTKTAVRAVGTANGQNPLSILSPCHRVIGSDGELRGFAGGVDIKKALLELENATCVAQQDLF